MREVSDMFSVKGPSYFLGLSHTCYEFTHSTTMLVALITTLLPQSLQRFGLTTHLLPLTSALLTEGYKQFGSYQTRLVFTPVWLRCVPVRPTYIRILDKQVPASLVTTAKKSDKVVSLRAEKKHEFFLNY